jgi:hypothetical protein
VECGALKGCLALPSTRNWPYRWPLSPTSPPQVMRDAQGNVSRQLARAVDLGGGAAPAPTRGAWGASAIRVPGPSGAAPEGLAGMAELRPQFPRGGWVGGGGGAKHVLAFRRELIGVQTTECTNARPRRKCAVPGTSWRSWVAASNHRPLITSDLYKALGSQDQREM